MFVFKFGGASVKSADAVRNLAGIINGYHDEQLIVVISAMGKTTNALEKIYELAWNKQSYWEEWNQLKDYHVNILQDLFSSNDHQVFEKINEEFSRLTSVLGNDFSGNYDQGYDQVISFGEIISTSIVSAYLNAFGIENCWIDVRPLIKTDHTYREGSVNWEKSATNIRHTFNFKNGQIYVTQGFLGSDEDGNTTTLGREGSDYSAAIIAYMLDIPNVVIWKDVPGVLNADPKYFDNTVKLEQLSYLDAIELAYYGASVIHPKTIKPLQNKNILLHVKSFLNSDEPGTIIGDISYESNIPMFIFKMDQVLIRISPIDFSFIAEEKLKNIFASFAKHHIKINLMQNSAISFQVCVNYIPARITALLEELKQEFRVSYETGLELITIRYYDESTISRVMVNKELILEQKSKRNLQLVVRDKALGM